MEDSDNNTDYKDSSSSSNSIVAVHLLWVEVIITEQLLHGGNNCALVGWSVK